MVELDTNWLFGLLIIYLIKEGIKSVIADIQQTKRIELEKKMPSSPMITLDDAKSFIDKMVNSVATMVLSRFQADTNTNVVPVPKPPSVEEIKQIDQLRIDWMEFMNELQLKFDTIQDQVTKINGALDDKEDKVDEEHPQ
jgi:hypothetical protein